MSRLFEQVFGSEPAAEAQAPARVNLLGEHTDYNDGFVLPMPLPRYTRVSVGPGPAAGVVEGHSSRFGGAARSLDAPPQGNWLDYVVGCVRSIRERSGPEVDSLRVTVESDVPAGAGISSSAALEVATLRALRDWLGIPLDEAEVAQLARRAEVSYVGMPCGVMDQMVSALGRSGEAMFLDTRTLDRERVALPDGFGIAVVHCGVPHRLVDGGYRQRVKECKAAAAALGVRSLRDLDGDLRALDRLPDPLGRRVRHVVTENDRVRCGLDALRRGDLASFGRMMTDSHRSQRDDYAVSIPEVDALVDACLRHGAAGARLTGGGFGGSVVALLLPDTPLAGWWEAVAAERPAAWLVHPASNGAAAGAR